MPQHPLWEAISTRGSRDRPTLRRSDATQLGSAARSSGTTNRANLAARPAGQVKRLAATTFGNHHGVISPRESRPS
jgi:hypothetical protein